MVSIGSLWLPILLSAVFVFVASSLIHMVLKYHASDYGQLPNEEAVRAAFRGSNPGPRQYLIPYGAGMEEMKNPAYLAKLTEGPVGFITLRPNGVFGMGKTFMQWFVFTLVVSVLVAFMSGGVLPVGAGWKIVFHTVGLTAFLAYAGASVPGAIWMGKPWSIAAKEVLDGLIYGLGTAAIFSLLWPN